MDFESTNVHVSEENKADLQQFMSEYQAAFPEGNIMMVLLLLFTIDMKTWKFPECFHESDFREQIKFIENNETLRKAFQEIKGFQSK